MDIILFEKVIIKFLFTDVNLRDKIVPFLISDVFDDITNKNIVTKFLKFNNQYDAFPSIKEMELFIDNIDTYNHLLSIMDIDLTEYNDEYLLDEIENFFKTKLVFSNIISMSETLKKGEVDKISEHINDLQNSNTFSFDTKVGTDLFSDFKRVYEELHDDSKVISTGINSLDKNIKGGIHEKTLTLFMGECVTKDTKVRIRIKKKTINLEYEYLETTIDNVIELIESGEYDIEVESPDGYVRINGYKRKGFKQIYELCVDGIITKSSANHLYETNLGWKFAHELLDEKDIEVLTNNGYKQYNIIKTNNKEEVVDLSVDHENHRYYTNNVSSHNTNIGKSLIMCGLASNMLLQNKNVLYITLEMSESKISERILANILDIKLHDLDKLSEDEYEKRITNFTKTIKGSFIVQEYPTKGANTNRIRNLLKELKNKKKFVPDVIFVDYIGIMLPNMHRKDGGTNTEIKTISEELRGLSVETKIPIVSGIQTNRGGFSSADLDLTDVADSIGSTATADIFWGISQSDELRASGLFSFILLKNRYGLNKIKTLVGVDYPKMRIYDITPENEEVKTEPLNLVDPNVVSKYETIKNQSVKTKTGGIKF